MNEPWVAAAITSDVIVAELLLRLKQRSSSSSKSNPLSHTTKPNSPLLSPIGWGDRKSRSKPSMISTGDFGKGQNQQQRSPSTPLPWNGGGGGIPASDGGYDNEYNKSCNRPSDLYRSAKIDLHQNSKREENGFGQVLCKVESENEINERRFVLPDLNETPALEG